MTTVTMPIEEYMELKEKAGDSNDKVDALADGLNTIKECLSECVVSKNPNMSYAMEEEYFLKVRLNDKKYKVLLEAGLLPRGLKP
jgi:uncharacterized coiled-coil DUF342 family protein